MADQLLEKARDLYEGQIVCRTIQPYFPPTNYHLQDFEGQKLAEFLATALLAAAGVRPFHVTIKQH
jgi:hypothetical protein